MQAEPGVWDKVKEKIGNVWGKMWGPVKAAVVALLAKFKI